jgi:hypothetical protein
MQEIAWTNKTQINKGGASRHLYLFGFYVLSKTCIALKSRRIVAAQLFFWILVQA